MRQQGVLPETLASLIETTDPDVVVFAELYAEGGVEHFPNGKAPDGYQLLGSRSIAITVLVTERIGQYRVAAVDTSGATTGFVVEPVDPDSDAPRIVAVHATRMSIRAGAENWQHGLDWIAAQCSMPDTIALGDFNASPASIAGGLGACKMPASSEDVGLAPTWPTGIPLSFGATIDHVMATSDWRTVFARTLEVDAPGTDHRPVFAILAR